MKRTVIMLLAAGWLMQAQAQNESRSMAREGNRKEHAERMQERREEINKAAGFTESEANAYWSIKDKMREEMRSLRPQRKERKPLEEMTDSEISARMDERFQKEQQMLDIRKKYHAELIAAVGPRKLALAQKAGKKHHARKFKKHQEHKKDADMLRDKK